MVDKLQAYTIFEILEARANLWEQRAYSYVGFPFSYVLTTNAVLYHPKRKRIKFVKDGRLILDKKKEIRGIVNGNSDYWFEITSDDYAHAGSERAVSENHTRLPLTLADLVGNQRADMEPIRSGLFFKKYFGGNDSDSSPYFLFSFYPEKPGLQFIWVDPVFSLYCGFHPLHCLRGADVEDAFEKYPDLKLKFHVETRRPV